MEFINDSVIFREIFIILQEIFKSLRIEKYI